MKKTATCISLFIFMILAATPVSVSAQTDPAQTDILPAISTGESGAATVDADEATQPPLKLTPDKSEIVRLDKKAVTIIVGNPAHLTILPENATTLVLIGKAPGATYFTALDAQKNVIMQRHVIVASPKEKYVRIRKSCATSKDKKCQETQVYYCPDMCHEIIVNPEQEKTTGKDTGKKSSFVMPDDNTAANNGENGASGGTTEEPASE